MAEVPLDDDHPTGLDAAGAASRRGRKVRRTLRSLIVLGLLLLVLGLAIGLSAGVSVVATAVLFAGLALALVGAIAYRLEFWSEVYAKDRPARVSRGPK